MEANTNLIPKNVMDEFKRRMQESRGYDAKRSDARRFLFTTMTARFGTPWWNLHREQLLVEMQAVEDSLKSASGTPARSLCDLAERQSAATPTNGVVKSPTAALAGMISDAISPAEID